MMVVAICQEFGWTYDEYMRQPSFFLEMVKEKLIRDQKEQEMSIKRMERGK